MTQNSKVLTSFVWSIAPKSKSSGKTIVNMARDLAVSIFNDDFTSIGGYASTELDNPSS